MTDVSKITSQTPSASRGAKSAAKSSGRDTIAKVRADVLEMERRLKTGNRATMQSVASLNSAFEALMGRVGDTDVADLRAHINHLTSHLEDRMNRTRASVQDDLRRALENPQIDHVRETVARATARLSQSEVRQSEAIQKVNEQIIRLATAIDNRVRSETREREALAARLDSRFSSLETVTETRVTAVEDQTAKAIGQLGSQITNLSAELSQHSDIVLRQTEDRIYESMLDAQHDLESFKGNIEARFDVHAREQQDVLSPVHRAMATLSARLEQVEQSVADAYHDRAASHEPAPMPLPISAAPEESLPPFPNARERRKTAPPQSSPVVAPVSLPAAGVEADAYAPIPEPLAPADEGLSAAEAEFYQPPMSGEHVPMEFDPNAFDTVKYDMEPAPQTSEHFAPPQQISPAPISLHASQVEQSVPNYNALPLHDYDNLGQDWETPQPAQTFEHSAPVYDPGYNPYANQGAPLDPSYAGESYNPYAPPQMDGTSPVQPAYEGHDYAEPSMASARPGAPDSAKVSRFKRSKKPKAAKAPRVKNSNSGDGGGGLTPRTLRTAASAAALVAVVSTGVWMMKDRVPGFEQFASQTPAGPSAQNPATATQVQDSGMRPILEASNGAPNPPVTIMPATGTMSQPEGPAIDPKRPAISEFATLDAAVSAGDPVAQLQKGLTLLQSGNEDEAAKFIRLSANQGQPAAQYYLGNLYENGQGVPQDASQARKLTELAARAGHRIAMYDLALYYIEGKGGVAPDMEIAAGWFRKAAEFGMTDAQYNLAVLYERGTGVSIDMGEAYVWYAIAGAQGDQDAQARAAQIKTQLGAPVASRMDSKIAAFKPASFNETVNGIFRGLPWNEPETQNRDQVAQVQSLLLGLGYDVGVADGAAGKRTRAAIKAYQRSNGLTQDGQINESLVRALQSTSGA